nr:hypothetical protein [Agrobacterium sp. T29]
MKLRIGKLDADIEEILAILPKQGFDRLDITDAHLIALAAPPLHHRDPFDHLLIGPGHSRGLSSNGTENLHKGLLHA